MPLSLPAWLGAVALALALPCAAVAAPTVLHFDDLGSDGPLPADYGGLDWSASGWSAFSALQPPYTAHSGSGRLHTAWGGEDGGSVIRFRQPASFEGAWFAGLSGATVSFQLYAQGVLVARSTTLDPGATPAFLASGYAGLVDAVVVASPEHGSFVMDDFSFSTPVPEPAALLQMLAGLGALLAVRPLRRRA
ncbi:hypothetical protein [Eleftheria terrae]|uniref:hypothetical protein n=1 Tax=Eleftheria terrae TaxID=1597781 RepID=UPI00263AB587|nr:hypothetical protein [Eleftheria terrae]WKB50577.1 hypothetical protein N7L95_12015 [Eleftheria terrae]